MIISFPNFFKVNGVIKTWIPWKIIEEEKKSHAQNAYCKIIYNWKWITMRLMKTNFQDASHSQAPSKPSQGAGGAFMVCKTKMVLYSFSENISQNCINFKSHKT